MPKKRGRTFKALLLVLLVGLAGALLYAHHRAARFVSDALTDALGLPVTVSVVGLNPDTGITLYGLEIKNPPGYPYPYLLNIKALSIKPVYAEVIKGRLVIDSVNVYWPTVYVGQDKSGAWNFKPIIETMNKKKGKKAHPFTLGELTVRGGKVALPDRGIELGVPDVMVSGLSSIAPKPFGFSVSVNDGKGVTLRGNGAANIYGGPPAIKAKFSLVGERLYDYIKPPPGLDLSRATVNADISADYRQDTLTARLDGSVKGFKLSFYKGKGVLDTRVVGDVSYETGADSLTLKTAVLTLSDIEAVRISGNVAGLRKDAAFDMSVTPGPVDLVMAAPYIPAGVKVAGMLRPRTFIVKGSIRPLRVSAEGALSVEGVGLAYKDMAVKGINGLARLGLGQDGTLSAGYDIKLLGGGLTGGLTYRGGRGEFKAAGIGLEPAKVGGALTGLTGGLDAGLTGTFDSKGAVAAKYVLTGTDIIYGKGEKKTAVKKVSVTGEMGRSRGVLTTAGDLRVEGLEASGLVVDEIKCAYKYGDGTLSLQALFIKEKDVTALVKEVDFGYNDGAAAGSFSAVSGDAYGVSFGGFDGGFRYAGGKASVEARGKIIGNPASFNGGADIFNGQSLKNPYLSGKLEAYKLSSLKPVLEKSKLPVTLAEGAMSISFSVSGDSFDTLTGGGIVKLSGLGLDRDGKPALRGVSTELRPTYGNKAVTLPETGVRFGDSFTLKLSGRAARQDKGWSAEAAVSMPETAVSSLQEGVLEALPPALKWADVAGTARLDARLERRADGAARVEGSLWLNQARLGLDSGLSIGPVDGAIPLDISFGGGRKARPAPFSKESFDKEFYGTLLGKYKAGSRRPDLVIKKVSFGFVEIDDIGLQLKPGDGYYEVPWFGLSGFGGRGYGYGIADFTGKEPRYGLSLILADFSLTELCDRAPGIKGYLSGKVDGLLRVLATGKGYNDVAGAAMFWAKDGPGDDRKISKEFIKKLMGSSMKKYMFIGDRRFDTGELDVIFSGGDLVFDNLLISHTGFFSGRDLNISVAPVSNKVTIDYLLDVIKEVGERAGQTK